MKISYYWSAISELKEAYDTHRERIMKKYSMTALEVDLILFLANNPQFDTATSIVKERKISKSHVSTTIQSLYKKGMLNKTEDKHNPRLVHLCLTEKTRDMVKDGQKEQILFFKNVMEGFSEEEMEKFVEGLSLISANIKKKYGC